MIRRIIAAMRAARLAPIIARRAQRQHNRGPGAKAFERVHMALARGPK
jgi:hypothetical protein